MLALAAATSEQTVSLNKHNKPKDSQTALKKQPSQCENAQSAEAERSCYFTGNEQQHRLGEDFFKQPCISLAKAFLGKVG